MTTSFYTTFSYEEHLQEGNSVDLPSSVLEKYTDENKSLPYFFKLKTSYHNCYVGVCEFTSDDYEVRISPSLADQLLLEENQIIQLELVENVPPAKGLRLEPLDKEFFDIEEYDTILEEKLSKFSVMYPTQIISFTYNDKIYRFCIKDIEPDWDLIDLENSEDFQFHCFNVRNQDIEVDIFNKFLEKELLEKRRQLQEEYLRKEKEEKERSLMKENDINILHIGQRLSDEICINLSREDIRKKRLERLHRFKK